LRATPLLGPDDAPRAHHLVALKVEPLDPWTIAVAPILWLMVAAVAPYVPARRGVHMPPAEVLRAN
jgi:hypothetical protein